MEAVNRFVQEAIHVADTNAYAEQYQQQSELLVINDFLSPDFVIEHFLPEVEKCTPYVHRVNVPGFKKSGSVSYHHLQRHAPNLLNLYRLDAMKQFIERIVGADLVLSPEGDPHAAALYYYTEPGDRIKMHYDKSFYKGRRYTVLLGMIQDSEHSKLICYPGQKKKNLKKDNPLTVATHPGTLVIFNGDVLWHEVSALGEQEKRVILTMEFLTDPRISRISKFVSDVKDRFLYFGKSLYQEKVTQ